MTAPACAPPRSIFADHRFAGDACLHEVVRADAAVVRASAVAVVAEDLELAFRPAPLFKVSGDTRPARVHRFSMLPAATFDVVEGQKSEVGLTTAGALTAVCCDHLGTQLLIPVLGSGAGAIPVSGVPVSCPEPRGFLIGLALAISPKPRLLRKARQVGLTSNLAALLLDVLTAFIDAPKSLALSLLLLRTSGVARRLPARLADALQAVSRSAMPREVLIAGWKFGRATPASFHCHSVNIAEFFRLVCSRNTSLGVAA